jgi:tRNA 2-selenouridine synthase
MWNDPALKKLFLASTPLIDVRSPVEFKEGSLPHSTNLPIMNDEERTLVGTCYKENGQAAAMKLGHELVSGAIKQSRIEAWTNYINANPETQVFCFRGGLRSQISCQWMREAGIERQPIEGGYKRMRRFFLSQIEEAPLLPLFRLGGCTGSGKTQVLHQIKNAIDLEKLASHRGSAFGDNGVQPSQIRFENELSLEMMKAQDFTIVEDESAVIGKLTIPKRFFLHMRSSPLIILKSNEETRIKNIFEEYVVASDFLTMNNALERIARRLGGVRFKEVTEELKLAFEKPKTIDSHAGWISALLRYYYDPFYERDIKRQASQIIFEGSTNEILEFITDSLASKKR